MDVQTFNVKINRRIQLVEQIKLMQAEEKELRSELVATFEDDVFEGTQTMELDRGVKLKCVKKITRALDNEAVKDVSKIENVLARLPADVAERLIKYVPKLSEKDYKSLANEHRNIIDEIITSKPGTPTLTVVYPKEEG